MRRSSMVRLTLLPMLASASVVAPASADPPSATPPVADPADPPASAPYGYGGPYGYAPPGPAYGAPGMTPPINMLDCQNDPNWRLRQDCNDEVYWYDGGVVRGGFGGYFYGPRVYPGWHGGWGGGRGGWGGGHGGWGG